jgi:hypothetical protein
VQFRTSNGVDDCHDDFEEVTVLRNIHLTIESALQMPFPERETLRLGICERKKGSRCLYPKAAHSQDTGCVVRGKLDIEVKVAV